MDTILAAVDDPTVWASGQNDDLKVIVIPQTHGEYPAPSEITGPGYGDQVEQIVGFDHQVTFFDPTYSDNCDFWNAMRSARNYHLAYRTSSKIHITQDPVTWIPKAPIADDLGSEVVWNVLAKWRNINTPCAYDVPANIFDSCYEPE